MQQQERECIICLDDKETEWLTLDCRHEYHKKCIHTWMRLRMTCPICVRSIHLHHREHVVELQYLPELSDTRMILNENAQRTIANTLCIMVIMSVICIIIGTILLL